MNKIQLKERCIAVILERMDGLHKAMKQAQDAANNETKSSSGDKYETGRAINQLDKDMYARQLAENSKELSGIMETNCDELSVAAGVGSFIKCDGASFFIIAGLGKLDYEGETIFIISPNAPLARSMQGKKQGESFVFNNRQLTILEIC